MLILFFSLSLHFKKNRFPLSLTDHMLFLSTLFFQLEFFERQMPRQRETPVKAKWQEKDSLQEEASDHEAGLTPDRGGGRLDRKRFRPQINSWKSLSQVDGEYLCKSCHERSPIWAGLGAPIMPFCSVIVKEQPRKSVASPFTR